MLSCGQELNSFACVVLREEKEDKVVKGQGKNKSWLEGKNHTGKEELQKKKKIGWIFLKENTYIQVNMGYSQKKMQYIRYKQEIRYNFPA